MGQNGNCSSCKRTFEYRLVSGFNDSAYACCDACGMTAQFNVYSKSVPKGQKLDIGAPIPSVLEEFVSKCTCGGRFRGGAGPRCIHCHEVLDAHKSASFIEHNAPGAAKGWRWQRNWTGSDAIIIEDRCIEDPWKE